MSQPFTPRDYQHDIILQQQELVRCATWAGMGLGKTVSTLTAIEALQLAGVETRPALVLAPLRVANSTWPDEVRKWSHLSGMEVQPLTGEQPLRTRALKNRNASVFTINYELAPWLIEACGDNWPFGMVVADESTKLKGFRLTQGGKRARALGAVAHTKCTRWVNLTGTPSPNGLQDLWGQQWFIDKGLRLGRSFKAFSDRWFSIRTFDSFSKLTPLPFAQEQIEDALRAVCLSIRAEDYFDLQEPVRNRVYIELPKQARALYGKLEREMFAAVGSDTITAVNAAGRTMKCLQVANGAAYLDAAANDDAAPRSKEWIAVHDLKLQALESIVNEAAGMPVLVAYHFRSDLARIQKAFPAARTLDNDPQTIRDWNAGKIPLLLAHPASAGHGLNLQDGGNILVFFSLNWNLEEHQQIIERIGPVRQLQAGHNRPVFIHYIMARGTVDDLVLDRLDGKGEVQALLLAAMKRAKLCA